jgi:hypothetical protein
MNSPGTYYENGRVRAQLFWLRILLLEGRHVLAPLLGHHQVTKNILRGNYVVGITLEILATNVTTRSRCKITRTVTLPPT